MFKNNFVKNFPAAGLSLRLFLRFFQINATFLNACKTSHINCIFNRWYWKFIHTFAHYKLNVTGYIITKWN